MSVLALADAAEEDETGDVPDGPSLSARCYLRVVLVASGLLDAFIDWDADPNY